MAVKIILVSVAICMAVAAIAGALLYRAEAEHDRRVLRDVLWIERTIHPDEPIDVVKAALQKRGYGERYTETPREAWFVKRFEKIPWGANVEVLLIGERGYVANVTVSVVDAKSGRPYLP